MARGSLREFARFAQATFLAMAAEMASFVLLERALPVWGDGKVRSAAVFLISSAAANALSFTLNRKRTFHSRNSLGYAVPVYVLYSAIMIALQTALGPMLEHALAGTLGQGAPVVSKAVMMALSFCVSYPVNKFIVMRPAPRRHA